MQRFVSHIKFLVERTGIPETQFKVELCKLFDRFELIKRAYLVIVDYSNDEPLRVALCLCCFGAADEQELVMEVSHIFKKFRRKFDSNMFLDVLFLMDFQELDVFKVCTPFYRR